VVVQVYATCETLNHGHSDATLGAMASSISVALMTASIPHALFHHLAATQHDEQLGQHQQATAPTTGSKATQGERRGFFTAHHQGPIKKKANQDKKMTYLLIYV
jgi:hypothetical protein